MTFRRCSLPRNLVLALLGLLLLLPLALVVNASSSQPAVRQVKDINPGTARSIGYLPHFAQLNGSIFFGATYETYSKGLWKSDGTPEGTVLVKNVELDSRIISVGKLVYFAGEDGVHGYELWRSDGSAEGTWMVKDIYPTPPWGGESHPHIRELIDVNGTLFFVADNGGQGKELWKSDGTPEGTLMVKDISPTEANPHTLRVLNGTLFFFATDGTHGMELWKSDGTAEGTLMVKDINPGPADSDPMALSLLTPIGDVLYFFASTEAYGYELWRSDGSAEGTWMVKDITPGPASTDSSYYGAGSTVSTHRMVSLGDRFYFAAGSGNSGTELWSSDGTAEGTHMVRDLNLGSGNGVHSALLTLNGKLLFAGDDGLHGVELWQSDGTAEGTWMVKDISPGATAAVPSAFTNLPASGVVLFSAETAEHGIELWQTDGTGEGTLLVQDINPGSASSIPRSFTGSGTRVFFSAEDSAHGRELWLASLQAQHSVMLPYLSR